MVVARVYEAEGDMILAVAHTRPATAPSYRAQLQPEEGTTSIGLEGQEHHPQDDARP
jgi:hypothetical protein